MELYELNIFSGKKPEIKTGWTFCQSTKLLVGNPNGKPIMFGKVEIDDPDHDAPDVVRNGLLDNNGFLTKDRERSKNSDRILVVVVAQGTRIKYSQDLKNANGIKIRPIATANQPIIAAVFCLTKGNPDEVFRIRQVDDTKRKVSVGYKEGKLTAVDLQDMPQQSRTANQNHWVFRIGRSIRQLFTRGKKTSCMQRQVRMVD